MSYKDFVCIDIVPEKKEFQLNEPITGEIFVKNNSPIELGLVNIQLSLILKHQGKGETDTVIIEEITINEYSFIDEGQTISEKFEFNSPSNVSYNGRNITQSIIINTKVDVDKTSEKSLRNDKLSKFKIGGYIRGVFKPDFYHEQPILISRKNANYNIKSAEGRITPGLKLALTILGISLATLIILSIILRDYFELRELIYGVTGILSIIFLIVYYFILGPYLSIGAINYKLKNLEGNFYEINLDVEKRGRSIQEINYQLLAEEKVTYDNGSSRSTAKHTFYKGPIGEVKRKIRPIREEADLPRESLPRSITNNDFEIIWYFKLTVINKKNQSISGKSKIILGYELD